MERALALDENRADAWLLVRSWLKVKDVLVAASTEKATWGVDIWLYRSTQD